MIIHSIKENVGISVFIKASVCCFVAQNTARYAFIFLYRYLMKVSLDLQSELLVTQNDKV